ncbi:putative AAA+ ATPase domain-containing protein [Seiridium unicorne]|uniref:AAA+ ATPase domain-containing protein n=1 Tax=Seiridium unicorne TaxID=138068 RepID=A0ABR2VEC6_9PEZI
MEESPVKQFDKSSGRSPESLPGDLDNSPQDAKTSSDIQVEHPSGLNTSPGEKESIHLSEDGGTSDNDQGPTQARPPHILPPFPLVNTEPRMIDAAHQLRHYSIQESTYPSNSTMERASFLAKYFKSMDWLLRTITNDPIISPPPPTRQKRKMAIAEMKEMTWREWSDRTLRPKSSYMALPAVHYSLYLLVEELPVIQRPQHSGRVNQRFSPYEVPAESASSTSKRSGLKPLPPRIHIASVASARILDTICNEKLRVASNDTVVILRPFKVLVHHADAIRARYDELKKVCDEAQKLNDVTEVDDAGNTAGRLTPLGNMPSTSRIFGPDTDWQSLHLDLQREAFRDFGTVVSFIEDYVAPVTRALQSSGDVVVYFHELWHLFGPGALVYVKDVHVPQKIWRVLQGTGGRKHTKDPDDSDSDDEINELALGAVLEGRTDPFQLDCFYLDFNGRDYVRVMKTFEIEEFNDYQEVQALSILPLPIAEQEGLVDRQMLAKRGEDFIHYTKPRYAYYRGRSLSHHPDGRILRRPQQVTLGTVAVLSEFIESSVVTDPDRCIQAIPDWTPAQDSFELSKTPHQELRGDAADHAIEDDRIWDVRMAERILDFKDPSQNLDRYDGTPQGDDVLLLPDRVFGFVLRTRRWACLQLGLDTPDNPQAGLQEMKPNADAWNHLEINPGHRSVIESLMKTHFGKDKSERRQFDLIKDKGKGIILLLHGVPGVGKTSTAETVADFYNKPLLPITCGDLGLSPAEVETNLQNSFQLAQAWDCVLLLDEADIFLAERSRENIERNALVSVFLRVLEYYEGVLFLTTNKVGSFDEAFKSRISMALYYPPLDQRQTLAIWKTQMERTIKNSQDLAPNNALQHIVFDEADIELYAQQLWFMQQNNPQYKPVWNGRQIRNAFQAAVAIAEFHRDPSHPIKVTKDHFMQIANVSNEFNFYLWRTKHQRNDESLNRRNQYRDDAFEGGLQFGSTPMPSSIGVQLYQNPQVPGMPLFYPQQQQQQQQQPQHIPGMPQSSSSAMMGTPMPQDFMQTQTMAQFQPIGAPAQSNAPVQQHATLHQPAPSSNLMPPGYNPSQTMAFPQSQSMPGPQTGQQMMWTQGNP